MWIYNMHSFLLCQVSP
ncbi:hypothetical protein R3I94_016451 [Phoxinus phoxinus]